MPLRPVVLLLSLCLSLCLWAGAATAQAPAAPGTHPPQRLALVVGIGSVGGRVVLDSARRDAQAVAMALRQGGFEVLLREDPSAGDLRAAFTTFREQLKPLGLGLVYISAPMAQVDGRNLVVPADATLNEAADGPAAAALLRVVGVPVQEAVSALTGPFETPRVLVLDGAWRLQPLARITPAGLARQRSPDGTMVLLGHLPAAWQDPPLADPASASSPEPKQRAASGLAKALVDALALGGITVAEALRAVRLEALDASAGRTQPALSGSLTTTRFYLTGPRAPAVAAVAAVPAAPPAPVASPVPAPAPPPTAPATAASAPSPAVAAAAGAASAPAAPASAPATATAKPDGRTERAPGQGERPVFMTRTNSFGHAEGDVLSYERVDTRKDELLASYVISIDKIEPDGQLQANGGQWRLDAEGRPLHLRGEAGAETRFEPAEAWWWARPRAGETREVQFTELYRRSDKSAGRISWRGQAQVGNARLMEVQAGEHEVLPIRVTGQGIDTPEGKPAVTLRFTRVVYFAPKLGVPVAMEIEDTDSSGKPLRRERVELTHAQQARTAN